MGHSMGFADLDSANVMQYINEKSQLNLDTLLEIENSNQVGNESSDSELSDNEIENDESKDISKNDLEEIFEMLDKVDKILSKDLNLERRMKTKLALKNNFKSYKKLNTSKLHNPKKQTSMKDFFRKYIFAIVHKCIDLKIGVLRVS